LNFFNRGKENEQQKDQEKGFLSRLKSGLSRTRKGFINKLSNLFTGYSTVNEDLFEELEELLIQADVGVKTTMELVEELQEEAREQKIKDPEKLFDIFQKKLMEILQENFEPLTLKEGLNIIMVVGVNGVGKTTTIAKLAQKYIEKGKKVMLGAGDTFRAGAIDQIQVWADRLNIRLIAHQEGSDAAAVAYDAVQAARSRNVDLLIFDTAGRLHTQKNLMEELKKVNRVIDREAQGAHTEVLLVVDATTGQNAISQANMFNQAVDVDGIALTKLDGTAKGGIVLAIKNEMGIPIKFIGVGEQAEDLQDFAPEDFVEALFAGEEIG